METQKVANQPSAMPRLTVFRFYLSGEPLQVGQILAHTNPKHQRGKGRVLPCGAFHVPAATMAGMDENPDKAPAEHIPPKLKNPHRFQVAWAWFWQGATTLVLALELLVLLAIILGIIFRLARPLTGFR